MEIYYLCFPKKFKEHTILLKVYLIDRELVKSKKLSYFSFEGLMLCSHPGMNILSSLEWILCAELKRFANSRDSTVPPDSTIILHQIYRKQETHCMRLDIS